MSDKGKKTEGIQIKNEIGYHYRLGRHKKDNKGILCTIIHTHIWQFWYNGPILHKAQTTANHPVQNR